MIPSNPPAREPGFSLAVISLLMALGSILFPFPGLIELYDVPVGTECRPMGQAMTLFVAGVGGPVVALVLAAAAFSRGRISRRIAVVAGILSLVPFPLQWFTLHWIVQSHNLILEP
jgi:hypothetical protein